MTKLRCPCLNVCIHVKENAERQTEGNSFVSESCEGNFFSNNLCEIELGVGGITKEVEPLVQKQRHEDWDVFTCLNCGVSTHALHAVKGYSRVLMSREMKNETLAEKEGSGIYSLAYRIKVQKDNVSDGKEDSEDIDTGAVLLSQDTVSKSILGVQEQMKKFLKAEEEAMLERIRQYTEQQKQQFAALQSQSYSDKKSICKVIKKMEQRSLSSSLHEAMIDNSELDNPVTTSLQQVIKQVANDAKTPLPVSKPVGHVHITQVAADASSIMENPHLTSRSQQRKKAFVKKPTQSADSDADPMFSLDGFNDDCEPFFESEEDDLSSSDNSFHFDDYSLRSRTPLSQMQRRNQNLYSASVPIGMPSMNQTSRSWDDADDADDIALPEPSKIAESMKALARSIQDSTDMFGELPRPRLNTMPLRGIR